MVSAVRSVFTPHAPGVSQSPGAVQEAALFSNSRAGKESTGLVFECCAYGVKLRVISVAGGA